jgi:hypothetical protein
VAAQTLNPLSFEVVVIDVCNPTMEAVLAFLDDGTRSEVGTPTRQSPPDS